MSTQRFEEPVELSSGSIFRVSPALKQMIKEYEFDDISKASENALEKCGPLAVCKGTYGMYTAFVDKEDKMIMSFTKKK